jgi:hypothetical protein
MLAMNQLKSENAIASILCCSNMLEKKLFQLYRGLSNQVEHPIIKSLLLYIAYDSLKHSAILKGICNEMPQLKVKNKDCEKILGDAWKDAIAFSEEISTTEKIGYGELVLLTDDLSQFENSLGREYYILVRLQLLNARARIMDNEICEICNEDLENLKDIFELITTEKGNHQEILITIKNLLTGDQETTQTLLTHEPKPVSNNAPIVRYQNPNHWFMP